MNSYQIIAREDEKLSDVKYYFVDCNFSLHLYFKIIEQQKKNKCVVYKLKYNKQIKNSKLDDINNILNNKDVFIENYELVDIDNSAYDDYLSFTNSQKDQLTIQLDQFITNLKKQRKLDEQIPLIEVTAPANDILKEHINIIYQFMDVNNIVFTNDKLKFFSSREQLSNDDYIISKSNKKSKSNFFFIPFVDKYKIHKKVVIVSTVNFKYVIEHLLTGEYILVFSDELRNSMYVQSLCKKYNVETSNDILCEKIYYKQNVLNFYLINLIEKYNYIHLYTIDNNKLKLEKSYDKFSDDFKSFVKAYKHTLNMQADEQLNILSVRVDCQVFI